jgi:tetratricopeptide (TPR) repeat protein
MFFPRLRRHAKWVFLFLAVAFALGFVGFGVGAGGVGFGDILKGSGSGSGIPSISDAQKRVDENPKDAKAFRDLATAYQAKSETTNAIDALESYVSLRPKDSDALRELAGLYLVQVSDAQRRYQLAQYRESFLATSAPLLQSINLGGRPLDLDPLSQAVSSVISQETNTALGEAQAAAANAVSTYKKIVALSPNDPTVQLELGEAARNANDIPTATAAYKKYLKLVPANDPTVREVKRLLKSLKSGAQG